MNRAIPRPFARHHYFDSPQLDNPAPFFSLIVLRCLELKLSESNYDLGATSIIPPNY